MSRTGRGLCRCVVLAAFAVAIAVLLAPPAFAHALLERSTPAPNETLETTPASLTLTFTEPPDPALSSVRLLGASGADVGIGPMHVAGRTITVPVTSRLTDGTYTVTWRAVSRTDGHVTAGSFAFGVGRAPSPTAGGAGAGTESPFPSAAAIIAKWLLYAGLSLLVAGAVVPAYILRSAKTPAWVVVTAATAAAGGWIGLVGAERSTIGVAASVFLSSEAGRPFVWLGVAVAVSAGAAVAWAVTAKPSLLWTVGAAAAAAMLIRAIGGHADAGSLPALQVAAQFIHLLAVGVWIGGIAWLLLLVGGIGGTSRPEAVRRFSTTAGVALGAVVVTGVIRALDEIGGPSRVGRLVSSDYGLTLSLKAGVAAVLIALGAWNRYVNVPRTANGQEGTRSLRRVLVAEAVLAAGVFALTGLLTGLPPAAAVATAPGSHMHEPLVATGSDFATTVRARVEITPGMVGTNRFAVRVVDYDTGERVPARRMSLGFAPLSHADVTPSTLELRRAPDGDWTGRGSQISLDDRYQLLLVVQTASGSTQVRMEISPRVSSGHTSVARAEGQPTVYTTNYPDGTSIQAYLDPGRAGTNQIHATAFDGQGDELPLQSISLIAIPPDGRGEVLQPIRFSPGHYAANIDTIAGTWTFEIRAVAKTGAALDAHFVQRIERSEELP